MRGGGDSMTAREYGESRNGRAAHVYRDDEDMSLCGVELVRGVTDATAGALCARCATCARRTEALCLRGAKAIAREMYGDMPWDELRETVRADCLVYAGTVLGSAASDEERS